MKKVVAPGEEVGTEIEFLPGKNVASDGEVIRATAVGETHEENKRVSVVSKKGVPTLLAPGMKVYGRVEEIFEPVALLKVEGVEEKGGRPISNSYYCVLHASNIKQGYVNNVRDEMHIGDVVKAEVAEMRGEDVMLTTKKDGLGVVKAFCSRCRKPLEVKGRELGCNSCGNVEFRKLGSPYRSV